MKHPRTGWRTLPWWILILFVGVVAYWIVDALLCIGLARFGSGPACSSLDGVMGAYRVLMKWAKYRHDELQALSGVAISVFTFLLAIFAYRLWRHGVQLARMQAQDTEAALVLARQTAADASRSADAARAAFVAGQRPWVQVLGADCATNFTFDDGGAYLQFDVRLKNIGRSPALDVRLHVEMRVESSLGAPIPEPDRVPVGLALFPAQEAVLACRVTLPSMLVTETHRQPRADVTASLTRDGMPRLYLAGAAFYGTPQDGSCRRTEFCFALRPGSARDSARASDLTQTAVSVPERSSVSANRFAAVPIAAGPHAVT